ncbi:PREDICTED: sec-independent protein translocase protein TATA, chloroplastic [Tarenaya hassleriana]|uniref:sec-independent protein translocase protein TATA, chloroplastic n=1 Tax=Tarenaya hassleriana TaxID=28532 RepID=UPI00053C6783|nr:PREDICTED: sec-independent protein translocase protein TATA, chloroplastic [Tarenaya hassleriana]
MATSAATLFRPPVYLPLSSSRSSFFSTSVAADSFARTRYKTRYFVVGRPGIRPEPTRKRFTCNALFGLGVPELVVIAGVAALVFGPKKLPEVGKSIGKTVKSFQQAAKEFESELKKEPDPPTDSSSAEKPVEVSITEEKKAEVSTSKESV